MEKYNHKNIESKWQKYWEKHPELSLADDKSRAEKKYILDMFPYPSGAGLHAGHVESYTATDIMSRYLRMKGKNVLHPQGWDAFGLPAENYAIKTKIHPSITTRQAIDTFKAQMNLMGFSYDWSREVNSSDPEYYKWTQWFFLLLYKNGLAYKKKAKVNWCDNCQTVLANEQAEGGSCERCQNTVVQKDMEQWFFRITDFLENKGKTSGLLDGLDKVDWPESTKAAQKNWIGRSEGAEFEMKIKNSDLRLEVYTTRVDTVFGMTYAVVAPEHKLIQQLKSQITNWPEVEKYLEAAKKKTDLQRMETKEKTGVKLEGVEAINPFNKRALPVFAADYVLAQYGTGAVMAVPAHDERDWDFAKKYDLPIEKVIEPCFIQTWEPGAVKPDLPFQEREAINAIVKHWSEDKYLVLKWNQVAWGTFITGGVEPGQTPVEAAIAEIKEETGYLHPVLKKELGRSHSQFYHVPKKVNRFAHFHDLYFELADGAKKEISEAEKGNHEALWLGPDEVEKFLTPEGMKYVWSVLRNGEKVFIDDGVVGGSGEYNGLISGRAREKMSVWLQKETIGSKKINYKIRDWLVSRQRYWGAPIPIIYCPKCGEVAVLEKDLPVELPTDVDFVPTGESPLVKSKKFHEVKCPQCGGPARRESDTMDTFVCSSWYYFRYSDPKNKAKFASKEMLKKWLPVDLYVGGAEHTVLHLLYSRFFTKVLHNLGYISFDEPFLKLRHQGIILAEDGRKMSKSLGNVVNPDEVVEEHGADALRLFEMFMGPLEDMKPWNTRGIIGISRFLDSVYKLKEKKLFDCRGGDCEMKQTGLPRLLHKTIKKVGQDIENLRYNTAIAQMMIFINFAGKLGQLPRGAYENFLKLLAPFAPHLAEELWSELGYKESIFKEKWPEYNSDLVKDETINLVIQINGKVRDTIEAPADINEVMAKKIALESEKIKNWLKGEEVKKIIFVKGKLVNIVV